MEIGKDKRERKRTNRVEKNGRELWKREGRQRYMKARKKSEEETRQGSKG